MATNERPAAGYGLDERPHGALSELYPTVNSDPEAATVQDAMSEDPPASSGDGDPWGIVASMLSGPLLYGGLGWLLDRWLGTSVLVGFGALFGMGLAVYLTYMRLRST